MNLQIPGAIFPLCWAFLSTGAKTVCTMRGTPISRMFTFATKYAKSGNFVWEKEKKEEEKGKVKKERKENTPTIY